VLTWLILAHASTFSSQQRGGEKESTTPWRTS